MGEHPADLTRAEKNAGIVAAITLLVDTGVWHPDARVNLRRRDDGPTGEVSYGFIRHRPAPVGSVPVSAAELLALAGDRIILDGFTHAVPPPEPGQDPDDHRDVLSGLLAVVDILFTQHHYVGFCDTSCRSELNENVYELANLADLPAPHQELRDRVITMVTDHLNDPFVRHAHARVQLTEWVHRMRHHRPPKPEVVEPLLRFGHTSPWEVHNVVDVARTLEMGSDREVLELHAELTHTKVWVTGDSHSLRFCADTPKPSVVGFPRLWRVPAVELFTSTDKTDFYLPKVVCPDGNVEQYVVLRALDLTRHGGPTTSEIIQAILDA